MTVTYAIQSKLGWKKKHVLFRDGVAFGVVESQRFSNGGVVRAAGGHRYEYRIDRTKMFGAEDDHLYLMDPKMPEGERVLGYVKPFRYALLGPNYEFHFKDKVLSLHFSLWRMGHVFRCAEDGVIGKEHSAYFKPSFELSKPLATDEVILILLTLQFYKNYGNPAGRGG